MMHKACNATAIDFVYMLPISTTFLILLRTCMPRVHFLL